MDIEVPDLVKALAYGLRVKSGDDTWNPSVVHVSDLSVYFPPEEGGACARALKLRLQGAERHPPKPGTLLMFDNAHGIHERIIPIVQRGLEGIAPGWSVRYVELSLKGLLPDGVEDGRMDFELTGPNGEVVIADTKTMRGGAFPHLDRERKPKDSHRLQVSAYALAYGADAACILYLDREGQNFGRFFAFPRADGVVHKAIAVAKRVKESHELPPVLRPTLEVLRRKGPDSLVVNEPWQCQYCDYRGVSCPGALADEADRRYAGRVCAKLSDDGTIEPVAKAPRGLVDWAITLYEESLEEA